MPQYAVLDKDNVVVNIIEWDGVTPYNPGEGLSLVFVPTVDLGRVWDGTDFVDPSTLTTTTVIEEDSATNTTTTTSTTTTTTSTTTTTTSTTTTTTSTTTTNTATLGE